MKKKDSDSILKDLLAVADTITPKRKSYKFIYVQSGELFEEHLVYRVYNKKSNMQIALISYYKPWKKYVFSTQTEHVFDVSCLENIIEFMNTL